MGAVFRRVLHAHPSTLSVLREEFSDWLHKLGWPFDEIDDLVLAVNEAVTNSIEHGYRHQVPEHSHEVYLHAEHVITLDSRQQVRIEIADTGQWRPIPADPGHRRRGLPIMAACTDSLVIDPTESGTRVSMLSRPLRLPRTARKATAPTPRVWTRWTTAPAGAHSPSRPTPN